MLKLHSGFAAISRELAVSHDKLSTPSSPLTSLISPLTMLLQHLASNFYIFACSYK